MLRWLYNLVIYLGLPYALWRLWRRHGAAAAPWREYFGFCPRAKEGERVLWMHSVSLGEAVAASALARHLQKEGYRLLLTYTTPAGRDWLRENHPQAMVAALPLDLPSAVRRFFRRARPAAGIIMEAEYWHNLLAAAKAQGVPLMLANARLGRKNAHRYRYIAALMRRMVMCFDIIAAQTARDAGRLRCFGARQVTTAGNLKFDLPAPPAEAQPLPQKRALLLAATRQGEEERLLDALAEDFWRNCMVVLAPRHPQRRDEISALLTKRGLAHQLRTRQPQAAAECQVYVADTLGEMHHWYASCDIAVIGGSFLPYGGQNPIEAMRAGAVVVVGPHAENYARLVRRAAAQGALVQAADAAGAMARVQTLLEDAAACRAMREAARNFYEKCGGALQRHVALTRQLLAAEAAERMPL